MAAAAASSDRLEPAISLAEGTGEPLGGDVERIASETQQSGRSNRQSCVIVIASFAIIFTGCGLNFAFGVYQALYDDMSQQPGTPFTGASPAQIDLIGTLAIGLMTIGAPFAVAWAKRFSPRSVAAAGGLIFGLANLLASFGTRLWHFELTQGLLMGVGTCLSYMVATTVAPAWFGPRRGLAMGIILSGTGVGGLVWAPVLRAAIDALGFRDTLRLTGALSAALIVASSSVLAWEPATKARVDAENAALRARHPAGLARLVQIPLVDWRVARSRKFAAQALGAALQSAAYYTPVFFFASYARALGYGDAAGANFTALSNACNALGKIAIGFAADRLGRLNTLLLTTLLSAAVTLALWVPSTLTGAAAPDARGLFVAFAVAYGIFASAYISLFPTSLVELFGPQHFASVNGALYMVRGLATMIGTPVGGALIRPAAGAMLGPASYEGMAWLVGLLMFAATLAVAWVRFEAMVGPDGRLHPKWNM